MALTSVTMDSFQLPLFILGPDSFPGIKGTLRVFEPRYKQMMDDCILDSKPFGYISIDPDLGKVDGWGQPAKYGTICDVVGYEESGSNLIIQISANSVFRVENVIQPVLPGQANLQNFPGVEELMGLAGNPEDGKLYLRADASRLEEPAHDYDRSLFSEFVAKATDVKDLLEMSSMYKGHALEIKSADRYETPESEADLIWSLCLSLCYEVDLQQEIFSKDNYSDIMAICIDRINSIKARMEEE